MIPNHPRRGGGFTLVELMVVLAIISLLASLLMPVMARARAQARRLVCVENLRQVGLAFHGYAHDHDNRFPMAALGHSSTANGGTVGTSSDSVARYFRVLAAELDTPKLLICPADTRDAAFSFAAMTDANLSYFASLGAEFGKANSLLAGDRNLTSRASGNPMGWTAELHQNRGNLLFGDGHVSASAQRALNLALGVPSGFTELAIPASPRRVIASLPANRELASTVSRQRPGSDFPPAVSKPQAPEQSRIGATPIPAPWQFAVGYALQFAQTANAEGNRIGAATPALASAGEATAPARGVVETEGEAAERLLPLLLLDVLWAFTRWWVVLPLALVGWLVWRRRREREAMRRIRRLQEFG